MRRPLFFFALTALVGCGRRPLVASPAPEDGGAIFVEDTAKTARDRLLRHGRVFDLEQGKIETVLATDRPTLEDAYADDAYLYGKDGNLRAFDLGSGKERWATKAVCSLMIATSRGAVCANAAELLFFSREGGPPRVLTLAAGVGAVSQLLYAHDRAYVLHADKTLEIFSNAFAPVASVTLPVMPEVRSPRRNQQGLVPNEAGLCGATYYTGPGIDAFCIAPEGALRWSKTFSLSKPSDPSGTWFAMRQLDTRFLVVSTHWSSSSPRRGVVVRLSDGVELARVEEEVAAAAANDDGSLAGMLVTNPSTRYLSPTGGLAWASAVKLENAASVVRANGALVVASYHEIATGAQLLAFDERTGATRWTGDVEMLPISHSKYFNATRISLAGKFVVMFGEEAAQSYVELFDAATGARTASDVQGLW